MRLRDLFARHDLGDNADENFDKLARFDRGEMAKLRADLAARWDELRGDKAPSLSDQVPAISAPLAAPLAMRRRRERNECEGRG